MTLRNAHDHILFPFQGLAGPSGAKRWTYPDLPISTDASLLPRAGHLISSVHLILSFPVPAGQTLTQKSSFCLPSVPLSLLTDLYHWSHSPLIQPPNFKESFQHVNRSGGVLWDALQWLPAPTLSSVPGQTWPPLPSCPPAGLDLSPPLWTLSTGPRHKKAPRPSPSLSSPTGSARPPRAPQDAWPPRLHRSTGLHVCSLSEFVLWFIVQPTDPLILGPASLYGDATLR